MKDIDYNAAETLEDVLEIEKTVWDEHLKARNEMLMDLASKSETINELGINQGTSFVLMMLQKPKKIVGVDIHLWKWRKGVNHIEPLAPRAEQFCKENDIELVMYEGNSIAKRAVHKVDLLHIDSKHTKAHLTQELIMHAHAVQKYIAFHDTNLDNRETGGAYALWEVVEKFLEDHHDEWELLERYLPGKAGHAVIKRIGVE